MCDCCCDENLLAEVCPNFKCSYRMCRGCREKEHGRQQGSKDKLFRCPACRVYVAAKKHVSMPKYALPGDAEADTPTVVVFYPRCFCLRRLLRRVWQRRHWMYAFNTTLEILFPICLCTFSLAGVIFVGRLVFCFFHGGPLFLECLVQDTMCAMYLVATGIIGAIYGTAIMCAACCVHSCFVRNREF